MPEPRYVGGQAVMDGVMMRGERTWAVAVRMADGSIETVVHEAPTWAQKYSKIPLLRGVVSLVESMSLGMRALSWSATKTSEDPEGAEAPLGRAALAGTMTFALAFFVGLFVLLPAVVSKFASHRLGGGSVGFNLLEGAFRLSLFLGYLWLIGRMADVRRLFQYHGAEHKVIAAYERGVPLTPESAQRFSTEHVRCGTNFLLLVLVLTIIAHMFVGRPGWVVLVLSRVLLIPLVAGLAFEFIRFSAKRLDRPWVRRLMLPGLSLQRMTTRQPTLDQLDVAVASLRAVLTAEQLAEVEARPLDAAPTGPFALLRPRLA